MTPYALLMQACGLSIREAAELHGVRLDTVKSWSMGRRLTPPGALADLRELYARLRRAADEALDLIEEKAPEGAEVEIGYPTDDHEARLPPLSLPCVGAWRAMAAMVVAEADRPVILVPRGSTVATAGAADMHER